MIDKIISRLLYLEQKIIIGFDNGFNTKQKKQILKNLRNLKNRIIYENSKNNKK